jgi:hypothetical protein
LKEEICAECMYWYGCQDELLPFDNVTFMLDCGRGQYPLDESAPMQ